MPWYDLPLERLREYRTSTAEPAGLDQWWADRIEAASAQSRSPQIVKHEPDIYQPVEVFDAEFSGAGGDRIKAWYMRPQAATRGTPTIVKFIGYGGGRGVPAEHVLLPALGYALFVMDSRGQGGRWSSGATGDGAGGPENSLVMTRGIASPDTYYYTRMFTDAALAVDAALALSGAEKVAVSGQSQGGALALAAAALRADAVSLCHADVPFLCDIQRAITLAPHAPYTEVPEFLDRNVGLIDAALETLKYVDCALLARRIAAPALVSVSLMDDICPPSTVFAAYNEIPGATKGITVYPYSGHDVPPVNEERKLRHLREHLPALLPGGKHQPPGPPTFAASRRTSGCAESLEASLASSLCRAKT